MGRWSEMKTTRKYKLLNTLGREVLSIFAVKRSQAKYRLKEEVILKLCIRGLKEKSRSR
jgi:hypothetical protein